MLTLQMAMSSGLRSCSGAMATSAGWRRQKRYHSICVRLVFSGASGLHAQLGRRRDRNALARHEGRSQARSPDQHARGRQARQGRRRHRGQAFTTKHISPVFRTTRLCCPTSRTSRDLCAYSSLPQPTSVSCNGWSGRVTAARTASASRRASARPTSTGSPRTLAR